MAQLGYFLEIVVSAKLSKLCIMKHMQSLKAHNSISLANVQEFLTKCNSLLY